MAERPRLLLLAVVVAVMVGLRLVPSMAASGPAPRRLAELPVNCTVGDWAPWLPCCASCGNGTRSRARPVLQQPANGGSPCPQPLVEYEACSLGACPSPIDCVVSNWTGWSCCANSTLTQQRTRSIISQPANGGAECPTALVETQSCTVTSSNCCSVDCVTSAWGPWTTCSATCGSGVMRRVRQVLTPASCGGLACPRMFETAICNTQPCPRACAVTEWSSWSACAPREPGGPSMYARARVIIWQPLNGGTACPHLSETCPCNVTDTTPCPGAIDCLVSNWTDWSTCSASCGGGTQTRSRTVLQLAAYGGSCPALSEAQACNTDACPPADCVVSDWGPWSLCSAASGGTQNRSRTVLQQPAYGGATCPALSETQACPVNCTVGGWSAWSPCTATECGVSGTQNRTRAVLQDAANGGAACPALEETQACAQCCPVDCAVGAWGAWSPCSAGCGGGTTTRARGVIQSPLLSGAACPDLEEAQACNTGPCVPVDCTVSAWGPWSLCSSASGGTQNRTRTVLQEPSNGGAACPALEETQACCGGGYFNDSGTCRECGLDFACPDDGPRTACPLHLGTRTATSAACEVLPCSPCASERPDVLLLTGRGATPPSSLWLVKQFNQSTLLKPSFLCQLIGFGTALVADVALTYRGDVIISDTLGNLRYLPGTTYRKLALQKAPSGTVCATTFLAALPKGPSWTGLTAGARSNLLFASAADGEVAVVKLATAANGALTATTSTSKHVWCDPAAATTNQGGTDITMGPSGQVLRFCSRDASSHFSVSAFGVSPATSELNGQHAYTAFQLADAVDRTYSNSGAFCTSSGAFGAATDLRTGTVVSFWRVDQQGASYAAEFARAKDARVPAPSNSLKISGAAVAPLCSGRQLARGT